MNFHTLNIINLQHREDRKQAILAQLKEQNITNYKFWPGIIDSCVQSGISRAHKQIVKHAKENSFPYVFIAEDDIAFTDKRAFDFFTNNIPESFDIYLGAISFGNISPSNTVSDFSGLLLYCIHSNFYETFLSTDETENIDRALRGKGLFKVAPFFVVTETAGFSDNHKKIIDNKKCFGGRVLFKNQPYN